MCIILIQDFEILLLFSPTIVINKTVSSILTITDVVACFAMLPVSIVKVLLFQLILFLIFSTLGLSSYYFDECLIHKDFIIETYLSKFLFFK